MKVRKKSEHYDAWRWVAGEPEPAWVQKAQANYPAHPSFHIFNLTPPSIVWATVHCSREVVLWDTRSTRPPPPNEESLRPGDWLVKSPNGDLHAWADTDFSNVYEPVDGSA